MSSVMTPAEWVHQRLSDDGLQTVSFDPFCVPAIGENDNAASGTNPPVVATMAAKQHSSATWNSVWWLSGGGDFSLSVGGCQFLGN